MAAYSESPWRSRTMSFSKHRIEILGVVLIALMRKSVWNLKFALFFTVGVKSSAVLDQGGCPIL